MNYGDKGLHSTQEKVEWLDREFLKAQTDWRERYKKIISFGKTIPQLHTSWQIDKYKIKGCQSQVWLVPRYDEGRLHFETDSDALIVKGLSGLVSFYYSGRDPQEIMDDKKDPLQIIEIRQHLSLNRSNGVAHLLRQVQLYAMVCAALKKKGVMHVEKL